MTERPPSTPSGRRARIYYATQTNVAPPTIVLFVNSPTYFNDVYQRFLVNRMRDLLPYPEVPIKLFFRARAHGEGRKQPSLEDVAVGEEKGAAPGEARSDRKKTAKRPQRTEKDAAGKKKAEKEKPKRRVSAGNRTRFTLRAAGKPRPKKAGGSRKPR